MRDVWKSVSISNTVIRLQENVHLPALLVNEPIVGIFPRRVFYGSHTARLRDLENTLNTTFDRLCNGPSPPTVWPEYPIHIPHFHSKFPPATSDSFNSNVDVDVDAAPRDVQTKILE
jgi:hypothetical protein